MNELQLVTCGAFGTIAVIAIIVIAATVKHNSSLHHRQAAPLIVQDTFLKGGSRFKFGHVRQPDGSWQPYALSRPANRRSSSAPKCHMYRDGRISISAGRQPKTLDRSKAIARYWADGYLQYQRTGVFPDGGRQVRV